VNRSAVGEENLSIDRSKRVQDRKFFIMEWKMMIQRGFVSLSSTLAGQMFMYTTFLIQGMPIS
jgi:hypothetical protein